jgi:NAD(P)H-hydrate epimerase
MKLVTAAQMRALEAEAAARGVSAWELMSAAGLSAAQETWMAMGGLEERLALVLAGPGNNGGDGLLAATNLRDFEAEVHVYLLAPRPNDDPALSAVREAGIPVTVATEDPGYAALEELLGRASCVLDALLGTGLSRAIDGDLAAILDRLAAARSQKTRRFQVIALDVPTGIDPDTGHADPHTVGADLTVCFGFAKIGLYQFPARTIAGQVVRVDIGMPADLGADLPYEEVDLRAAQRAAMPRPLDAHKGTFGRAVLAAGSRRYPGAAVLAAEACARSGAGLTTIAAPASVQPLLASFRDATHEPLPDTDGVLNADAARALLRALPGAQALLAGPGLDLTPASREFVRTLAAGLDAVPGLRAVVLDADALNALAGEDAWHDRFALPRVLTPHPGEMARLLHGTVAAVQANRLDCATRYAQATRSIVVLKGACTVIAAPDGRAHLSSVANPMLAHGGTGDVLAGTIVGLIAQGADPFDAATAAVYMQGELASMVGHEYGAAAGLAQDLLRAFPDVRKTLDPP